MDYDAFTLDLPEQRSITFRSAEENEEFMQSLGVNQEMRQLRRGPFRSDFAFREAEQVGLYADRFSTSLRMYLAPPPGEVGLAWLRSAGAPLLASGLDAANDKLLFFPKNAVAGLVLPDLGGSECISIPEERLFEMMAAFCPDSAPPEELTMFEGNTPALQTLGRTIIRFLTEPEEELNPEWVSNLLAATFGWIEDSSGKNPSEDIRSRSACRRIARKAEEYIQENYHDPVSIEDVCRESGVGLRTLQRCVRKYFDVTVTDLIESARMTAAHRELTARRPEECTVTQIALDSGFSHLGRFSLVYRERYGLSPSEQLAHCPGQKH